MLEDLAVGNAPRVVGDEFVADWGSRDGEGEESSGERNLPCAHRETCRPAAERRFRYSHSIVAGGFELTSYATRLTPRTSLMIRFEMRPRTSCGNGNQSAVMPSRLVTARSATTLS